MYKKIFTSILMFILVTGLCGCSVSYRNPDEMKKNTTKKAETTTTVVATTTEQVIEVPQNFHEPVQNGIEGIFGEIEDLSSFKIEKIHADLSSDIENRVDVVLDLVWTVDFEPAVAKSIAQKRCNTISVKVADQLPYVSNLRINIIIPSLDNASVTAVYKQHGSTLNMVETKFDEKFDQFSANKTVTRYEIIIKVELNN